MEDPMTTDDRSAAARTRPTREQMDRVNTIDRLRQVAESQRMDFDSPNLAMTLDHAADLLALIDKENTMSDDTCICPNPGRLPSPACPLHFADAAMGAGVPDDTIPVPRALIERAKEALIEVPPSSRNADIYGDLHALLDPPKPPAPRLRVVNLDGKDTPERAMFREEWRAWVERLEAQPDVLTVIEQTEGKATADRIRAALNP